MQCCRYVPTQAFNFAFKDSIKQLFPRYDSKKEFGKFFLVQLASGMSLNIKIRNRGGGFEKKRNWILIGFPRWIGWSWIAYLGVSAGLCTNSSGRWCWFWQARFQGSWRLSYQNRTWSKWRLGSLQRISFVDTSWLRIFPGDHFLWPFQQVWRGQHFKSTPLPTKQQLEGKPRWQPQPASSDCCLEELKLFWCARKFWLLLLDILKRQQHCGVLSSLTTQSIT